MKANKWKTEKTSLQESTEMLLNPGCGWYEIHSFWVEKEVSEEEIQACLNPEHSLVLVRIHLGAYQNAPLDATALKHIKQILSVFERAKKDVILRCCYDFEGMGMAQEPGEFSKVVTHMNQVANVVAQYENVVYLYQGVLLGSWGEMHTSKFLRLENIAELSEIFRKATKEMVWHGVRKPEFKSSNWENVTIFDDGILGSPTHLGTVDFPTEMVELEKIGLNSPYGGEIVGGEDALSWSLMETVERLERLHVSYLNCRHDETLLQHWEQQRVETNDAWNGMNGRDYIGRHLGYRFYANGWQEKRRSSLADSMCLEIYIENKGFSDIYEEVEWHLLRQEEQMGVQSMKGVCPSGRKIRLTWEFPRKAGTYYLALRRRKDKRPIYLANPSDELGRMCLGEII
nr:DUF4874 domain-containing protein [Eubacterium sp.]